MTQEEYNLEKTKTRYDFKSRLRRNDNRYRAYLESVNEKLLNSYKGKYFKYQNEWNEFQYYKVTEKCFVKFSDDGKVYFECPCISYQTLGDGAIRISTDFLENTECLTNEITEGEFVQAQSEILNKLQ